MTARVIDNNGLKAMLAEKDPRFWPYLFTRSLQTDSFVDLFFLSTLRRKAIATQGLKNAGVRSTLKVAVIGGYSPYPFIELLEHMLFVRGIEADIWVGDYDNYVWEITDRTSGLYEFGPEVVVLIPSARRYGYKGKLSDPRELVEKDLAVKYRELLDLCCTLREQSKAEIVLCNFITPHLHDLGMFRTRTLASEWSFFRMLNLELGLNAPSYIHICDLEFLASRTGGISAKDDRSWFESKQAFAPDFSCVVAKETALIISSRQSSCKKMLVLDLDGTIWGGKVGDYGIEGIELGETSSQGESFKAFQAAILELHERGVLLAVCSKNDLENALEPFEKHPEMILRREHITCFKANWDPKPDNIIAMAKELNLGLDSVVFVDDNPAEIEMMRQFAPAVTSILLGPDPSTYVTTLKDSRLFEPRQITQEDVVRGTQYKQEQERNQLQSSVVDMESFLTSLEMEAIVSEFTAVDIPRITQLISRSNQFNLTTKRCTEAEVANLVESPNICLSLRLNDKFGELGLVSVVIGRRIGDTELSLETWLMSCRVLKRQVEHFLMNELVRRATELGFKRISGVYLPSEKNRMVKDFYSDMQFKVCGSSDGKTEYELDPKDYKPFITKITMADQKRS